jgi:hypothetical protein
MEEHAVCQAPGAQHDRYLRGFPADPARAEALILATAMARSVAE